LNDPWGIALAPSDFGAFSDRLLIGNFGDGTIQAFNVVSGDFEGTLLDASGQALAVDGLWALGFGLWQQWALWFCYRALFHCRAER
jgi:uncharacterized protein (TIGR03118 family)